jgi:hypothetical protein
MQLFCGSGILPRSSWLEATPTKKTLAVGKVTRVRGSEFRVQEERQFSGSDRRRPDAPVLEEAEDYGVCPRDFPEP